MNNLLLTSETPAHERLILLFTNIFVSDYKTYFARLETYARHHQIIREHATGNMRNFLSAILKDPAVLVYLNNDVNTRANINENLAREYLSCSRLERVIIQSKISGTLLRICRRVRQSNLAGLSAVPVR